MKRETITQALGGLDDRFVSEAAVYAPGTMQEGPERIVRMKKKRFLSIVLAAALILALGITAYAAWSTHAARQEEIKADLKIEENNVSSYAEYPVPEAANSTVSDVPEEEGSESELVLLSAVNAGEFQRVYVNISPVSEKCIADYPGYPGALNFSWSIDGTDLGGYASPRTPSGITLHGQEAIRDAVLQYAYDRETQTLTLECIVENMFLEKAAAALGTGSFPLLVHMSDKDIEMQTFGPVSFTPVDEQTRYFDFGHAVYTDAASGKSIEISGLELTPFGAVWKVRYEGAEAIHSPNGDPAVHAGGQGMHRIAALLLRRLGLLHRRRADRSVHKRRGGAPLRMGQRDQHRRYSEDRSGGSSPLEKRPLTRNFKPLLAKSRYPLFRDTGSLRPHL